MTDPIPPVSVDPPQLSPAGAAHPAPHAMAPPGEPPASRAGWPVGVLWLIVLVAGIAGIGHWRWGWWPGGASPAPPPAARPPGR